MGLAQARKPSLPEAAIMRPHLGVSRRRTTQQPCAPSRTPDSSLLSSVCVLCLCMENLNSHLKQRPFTEKDLKMSLAQLIRVWPTQKKDKDEEAENLKTINHVCFFFQSINQSHLVLSRLHLF